MSRSFPQNFDLRFFEGPRARQFAKPEDAFQQLVGEALKEVAGPCAHISPTRGRDGSIDAFVLEGASLNGPFEKLSLPLIVECKTHDDTVETVERNILGQWRFMERKLEANARSGWKDLFEPWLHARGYAYCVSAYIGSEQLRNKLTEAIQNFFTTLSPNQRPPIEADDIRVIDWSDLRQWLEMLPHVSDGWLGIELNLILDHATYLSRLSGFREYLLPSRLEFVPPSPDSLFHPQRVLEEIERANERYGVLLVGAGGVGKTRTAIEVATLAADAGWRVLHILPDEPGVETEDVAEIVLPYRDSRTLLVFDYIDQMQKLDLGSIRRSLIPEAADRGIRLRLLANSRPGWMELTNPERDVTFSITNLQPTESHKTRLIQIMATRVAPRASGALGLSEVIRLCGTRAIIALLIARELESRAVTDLLAGLETRSLRSGDLVEWLSRRLLENALLVKLEQASLSPPRPETPMIASAAVLACAPETRDNLIVAAESAYRYLDWPTASEDAQYLVDLLVKLGWLEARGGFVFTAHDVVADEVLDQTSHAGSIVFEREFTAALSFAFEIPHGIGRLATAIRRVLGSVQSESNTLALTGFLRRWLQTHASALGKVLEAGDPNLTSYALGAILSGPPWDEIAIQHWTEIVSPWLSTHSSKPEARHLLYKGLKHVSADQVTLVNPALAWLAAHGSAAFATFVIKPLLDRKDLSKPDAEQAKTLAFLWLEQHHNRLDAQFVIYTLLERTDLSNAEAVQAKRSGFQWLEQHHNAFDAEFVISSLLERTDLTIPDAAHARGFALTWLKGHSGTVSASFVIYRLLERREPASAETEHVKGLAFRWLGVYETIPEARFVLDPLLERTDLTEAQALQARETAIRWLSLHQSTLEAGFVLPPLLDQRAIQSNDAPFLVESAVKWLQIFYETTDAEFVLKKLFRRDDVPEHVRSSLLSSAIQRLRLRLADDEATYLLRSCLQYRISDEPLQRELVALAIEWLELHPHSPNADYVWNRLLRYRRHLVSDGDWLKAARFALPWLKRRAVNDRGIDQTTNSLLMRPQLMEVGDRDYLIGLAIELLGTHLHEQGRRRMVASLEWLLRSLPEDDPMKATIESAL